MFGGAHRKEYPHRRPDISDSGMLNLSGDEPETQMCQLDNRFTASKKKELLATDKESATYVCIVCFLLIFMSSHSLSMRNNYAHAHAVFTRSFNH